jgi:hypothetical protein
VKNSEELHGVKNGTIILHEIKLNKANCIGYILHRNFHLKRVTGGKIEGRLEMRERRGRRRKQLLNYLNKPEAPGNERESSK